MEPPILRSPPPRTLDALTAYEDQGVREAVARHPATPAVALEAMAGELDRLRDLRIARALAGNSGTPSRVLEAWLTEGTGGWKTLARTALRGGGRAETAAGAILASAEHLGVGIACATDRVAAPTAPVWTPYSRTCGRGTRSRLP